MSDESARLGDEVHQIVVVCKTCGVAERHELEKQVIDDRSKMIKSPAAVHHERTDHTVIDFNYTRAAESVRELADDPDENVFRDILDELKAVGMF